MSAHELAIEQLINAKQLAQMNGQEEDYKELNNSIRILEQNMSNSRANEIGNTQAYLWNGMLLAQGKGDSLVHPEGGQLEMVDQLWDYAKLIEDEFIKQSYEVDCVYLYEIIEPLGQWIGTMLIKTDSLPTERMILIKYADLIQENK